MTTQEEMSIPGKELPVIAQTVPLSADPDKPEQATIVSVVLPAHNEVETIRETVIRYFREIGTSLPIELIVAEDGSVDGTKEILASLKDELPIVLLTDQRRKGYAKGVSDALKSCTGSLTFFSDSDGQYSASDFWKLWKMREEFDLIVGYKVRRKETLYRIILASGFRKIINVLFGLELRDPDCGFRLIHREVVEEVIDEVGLLEYSFWAEFTIRASLKGFKVLEVPINHSNRTVGVSHIYPPSKIPMIVTNQLRGLARLYFKRHEIQGNTPRSDQPTP